jgi:hypothetical protein
MDRPFFPVVTHADKQPEKDLCSGKPGEQLPSIPPDVPRDGFHHLTEEKTPGRLS